MTRVIGLGSPFGDDRAGWWVIDQLDTSTLPDVDVHRLDRPGAGLVAWMEGVDRLLIIDAVLCDAPPGTLLRIEPDDYATPSPSLTSHEVALSQALALADALGCLPQRIEIIGIAIDASRDDHPAVRSATTTLATRLGQSLRDPEVAVVAIGHRNGQKRHNFAPDHK